MKERSPTSYVMAALLLLATVAYFAATLVIARHQVLIKDEVYTMWIARDAPSIMGVLKAGGDTAPPTYYLLERAVGDILGFTPFALRVPSILAFFAFLGSIFFMVRRFAGDQIAAIAAVLPLFSSAYETATYARPYALVVACFGLIAMVWSHDERPRPARWRAVVIALLLAFAIAMHFYAVLLVPLFGAMELVWFLKHRLLRWPFWIAMLAGAGSLLLSLPVILPINRAIHQTAVAPGYYARPAFHKIFEFLQSIAFSLPIQQFFVIAVAIGLCVAGWHLLNRRTPLPTQTFEQLPGAPEGSLLLGAVLFSAILYPLLNYAFAVTVTKVLNERYMYGAVLGLSAGVALALCRLRWPATPKLVLFAVMVLVYARQVAGTVRSHGPGLPHEQVLAAAIPGDEPIVMPNGPQYFEGAASPDPAIRRRAFYVLPPAGTHNPNPEPERLAIAWKALKPELNVMSNEEFVARYPKFYVLSGGNPYESITAWAANTMHARLVTYTPSDWQLFEVVPQPAK